MEVAWALDDTAVLASTSFGGIHVQSDVSHRTLVGECFRLRNSEWNTSDLFVPFNNACCDSNGPVRMPSLPSMMYAIVDAAIPPDLRWQFPKDGIVFGLRGWMDGERCDRLFPSRDR
jgi:hypothetical protein